LAFLDNFRYLSPSFVVQAFNLKVKLKDQIVIQKNYSTQSFYDKSKKNVPLYYLMFYLIARENTFAFTLLQYVLETPIGTDNIFLESLRMLFSIN
jgi:hypothetical protein